MDAKKARVTERLNYLLKLWTQSYVQSIAQMGGGLGRSLEMKKSPLCALMTFAISTPMLKLVMTLYNC